MLKTGSTLMKFSTFYNWPAQSGVPKRLHMQNLPSILLPSSCSYSDNFSHFIHSQENGERQVEIGLLH